MTAIEKAIKWNIGCTDVFMKRLTPSIFLFLFLTPFNSVFSQGRPNILWIVSEDNSPFIGAYGDSFATTPNLDKLASQGILYENAFATSPVCAPARSTLITGMYSNSLGTENMRSEYPIPGFVRFFPKYLREAGYYTSNNSKKDYNTVDQKEAWDESSKTATYRNRDEGQPFFSVFNLGVSHESSIHKPMDSLFHDPDKVPIPPYHPRTAEMKHDWAQYYDKVQLMDEQVGNLLQELEDSGLADDTIVFYYSDHGGVLGRSKRYMYESGLRVPLIIRFPKKYAHLAPDHAGTKTDRIVSFVDFAPTVLSLSDIEIPEYMQGRAFLGKQQADPSQYAFANRGRMDERRDLIRSVRDKKYRYIRNYMPHKIYAQHLEYLWRAPSMRSWEAEFKKGNLNKVQSRFFGTKPAEELYDVTTDPHNIDNLAGQKEYRDVLTRMRKANEAWLLEIKDVGFVPEPMTENISRTEPPYTFARGKNYPIKRILKIAAEASSRDPENLPVLWKALEDPNPIVRYWGVLGHVVLRDSSKTTLDSLTKLTNDKEASVRNIAAEALYDLGDSKIALSTLSKSLESRNLMVRVQALNILEQMGKDALPALPSIKKLLPEDKKNRDYDLRLARYIVFNLGSYEKR